MSSGFIQRHTLTPKKKVFEKELNEFRTMRGVQKQKQKKVRRQTIHWVR